MLVSGEMKCKHTKKVKRSKHQCDWRQMTLCCWKVTKHGSRAKFGWKQTIFKDLKRKGTDLKCMAEKSTKTQTSYSVELLLQRWNRTRILEEDKFHFDKQKRVDQGLRGLRQWSTNPAECSRQNPENDQKIS